MRTPHRKALTPESNPGLSCCKAKMPTSAPLSSLLLLALFLNFSPSLRHTMVCFLLNLIGGGSGKLASRGQSCWHLMLQYTCSSLSTPFSGVICSVIELKYFIIYKCNGSDVIKNDNCELMQHELLIKRTVSALTPGSIPWRTTYHIHIYCI